MDRGFDERVTRIERLAEEERRLSSRRCRLHNEIELMRSGLADPPEVEERLPTLLEEERVVSDRRRHLHGEIDALPLWPDRRPRSKTR